jgi:hypothetical protein
MQRGSFFEELNMKLVTKAATALILAAGIGSPAFAQSASTTTTGTTTIIQPVTISQNKALAFGTLVRPTSGSSTITIGTAGDTVTATGNAVVLARGATSRARYTVTGEGGETVSVNMPATFDLTKTGAPALTVTLARNPAGNLTLSNALGTTGTASLDIGGSFAISDATPTGDYSGTFVVSVAYN